jgi:phage/conjugal plasmid C-4 type zinc finger TraR family protein
MLEELEMRKRSIRAILVSHERLPGYSTLKVQRVLPQIQRAIQKLSEATYGFCDDCDDVIPEERLQAVPGATRCVLCQTLAERRRL